MEHLLEKAKSGDKNAEKEIFSHLFVRFKYLAKRRIGGENCEDLAQEACITIAEKYKTEEYTVGFTAWAYGVLKMKIGNYLQARKRLSGKQTSFDNGSELNKASNPDPGLKRALSKCIKKIAKEYRRYARALNLTFLGYDTEEICRRLAIKPGHYYVVLNRGRAMLKECLRLEGMLL